ncbi:MAG TPA: carboxypeptidase regulatory-like domain-containing protein [Candidatus Acidoferrales bacterium]|nr:carboxypeptidase regulatory-like domain-containing protein [Candidatus Acidoferrales bacterium]
MLTSRRFAVIFLLSLACFAEIAFGQEQSAPATASGTPAQAAQPAKKKYSHAQDFLIKGTVFTDKALAFPGVQLRIKRAGDKKFRWETYSNSRGEFAVRVPQGAEYELVVHNKGFADQTRPIDAKTGDSQEGIVFRMAPSGGKK